MTDTELLFQVRNLEVTCGKPILEIASDWATIKRGLDFRRWLKDEPSLCERVERLCEEYAKRLRSEGKRVVGVHGGIRESGTSQDHPSNPGDRTGLG